jgi:hypothetical protein
MLKKLAKNLSNLPGWRSNEKIVVIESDDWGSIRMPSLKVYETLKEKGLLLDTGDSKRYNTLDTLASAEDLEKLFLSLEKFRGGDSKHPKITAVSLVGNPDFERIRENNFEKYFFELLHETFSRYDNDKALELWKTGIASGLFEPQFHGREHLNIAAWMRRLKSGDSETLLAFDYGIWAFKGKNTPTGSYQAAFDLEYAKDLEIQKEVIISGLDLFEKTWGYKATFFVPPNGPFNNSLEEIAASKGIKYMSASKIQKEVLGEGKIRKVFHSLGKKNKWGQRYITRNCFFEPSSPGKDWVQSCLEEMEIAFKWKKPAVISSHRVNYVGVLNEENRNHSLKQLEKLMSEALKKWPDIKFMSSSELGSLFGK